MFAPADSEDEGTFDEESGFEEEESNETPTAVVFKSRDATAE